MLLLIFPDPDALARAERALERAGLPWEARPLPGGIPREHAVCLGIDDALEAMAGAVLAGIEHRVAESPEAIC